MNDRPRLVSKIFVSYSRADAAFVVPFTTALRVAGATAFRDEDSIEPGDKWAKVIAESVVTCEKVFLFWSVSAADSKNVEGEYMTAMASGKAIVPILLDETPLPDVLAAYHWIDFREALRIGVARTKASPIVPPAPITKSPDQGTLMLPNFSWFQWMAVNNLLPPTLTGDELAEMVAAVMPFVLKDAGPNARA